MVYYALPSKRGNTHEKINSKSVVLRREILIDVAGHKISDSQSSADNEYRSYRVLRVRDYPPNLNCSRKNEKEL